MEENVNNSKIRGERGLQPETTISIGNLVLLSCVSVLLTGIL